MTWGRYPAEARAIQAVIDKRNGGVHQEFMAGAFMFQNPDVNSANYFMPASDEFDPDAMEWMPSGYHWNSQLHMRTIIEGGMVWTKQHPGVTYHPLQDPNSDEYKEFHQFDYLGDPSGKDSMPPYDGMQMMDDGFALWYFDAWKDGGAGDWKRAGAEPPLDYSKIGIWGLRPVYHHELSPSGDGSYNIWYTYEERGHIERISVHNRQVAWDEAHAIRLENEEKQKDLYRIIEMRLLTHMV